MKMTILFTVFLFLLSHGAAAQSPEHAPHAVFSVKPGDNSVWLAPFHQVEPSFSLPGQKELEGFAGGTKIYAGASRNHRLHGRWQSWYPNGQRLDSGTLKNGVPDGEWKYWDQSGRLLALRHYDADKLRRVKEEMRLSHPKKTSYPLTELYKKNQPAARQFLQAGYSFPSPGKRPQGKSLREFVENNFNPGRDYHPVFTECLHHGLYMNFFAGGQTRDSGYYKDGLRHGAWLHRESGQGSYWIGAYSHGVRQQEWKKYSPAGKLLLLVFYNREGAVEWRRELNPG